MADRSVALTTVKGGINRLRTKGAALNDSLFDLLNGFITSARTVKVRPGTFRHATLPVDTFDQGRTKGLVSFDGSLHVFSVESVEVPPGFTLHVVQHPVGFDANGADIPIKKVHFAAPFMGFIYAVIEFAEADLATDNELGNTFHYWIQTGDEWKADTAYKLGDVVNPTVPNGFSYRATRISAAFPSWAPNVQRRGPTEADIIEPAKYNDFFYTVVDTLGSNPRSGTVEPIWPEKDGAQITEESEGGASQESAAPTPQPNPDTRVPRAVSGRYTRTQIP